MAHCPPRAIVTLPSSSPHFINESTKWGQVYDLLLTSVEDRFAMEAEAKGMIEAAVRGDVPLEPFMREVSTEAANKIIRAVTCGETYIGIMNLPNVGQISNLSRDAVVETYGAINALGANAIMYGDVPAGVQNILQKHIFNQEMTIQAALAGDRNLALQVLLNDPLSSRLNVAQASQLLDEMLEANQRYLPNFFQQ